MQISGLIGKAFSLTTGKHLPSGITITVAPRDHLLASSMAFLNEAVVGLSLRSSMEIFVVAGSMDEVVLTIGHELGHVIKPAVRTAEEEEAKAFAFEAAWAKAIFNNDIGGLGSSINSAALDPARNRLHDVAFNFVSNNRDIEPLQLFDDISNGNVSRQQIFEGMQLQPLAAAAAVKPLLYPLPAQNKTRTYGGYLNRSRVQNLPPFHSFFWSDLGTGVYGMYIPMTTAEFINERLLRSDLEQLHRTLGHEYSIHHVMKLPDGYAAEALEEAMFWTAEDADRYKR